MRQAAALALTSAVIALTAAALVVWWVSFEDPPTAPVTSDPCDPSCGIALGEALPFIFVIAAALALGGRLIRAAASR
jgi:hypothetical protein